MNKSTSTPTTKLIKISMLSVLSFLLMYIEAPLPMFPLFLKLELSDVPAVLGAYALGPIAGVLIELVKNLLHLTLKWGPDSPIGELANFIIGTSFVLPAGWIYSLKKTKTNAIQSMLFATATMGLTGGLANYYILIPFYTKLFPIEVIIEMGSRVNSTITDLRTLILYGIVPFNIIKGVIVSAITFLAYKHLSGILHK